MEKRIAQLEASRKFLIEDQALLTNERSDLQRHIVEQDKRITQLEWQLSRAKQRIAEMEEFLKDVTMGCHHCANDAMAVLAKPKE
jgi:chromosome segregation ATPase